MAERRFYEFIVDENYLASFEESVCRVEEMLLPAYRDIVECGRFNGEPEQKAQLAILLAFQFMRTRSRRDQFLQMERQLTDQLEKRGISISDVSDFQPFTDDTLRSQHIRLMRDAVGKFAQIIATKDFLLVKALRGRSFYLSDNPVALHNSQMEEGLFGNLGLSRKGIEIYMPLTSKLMLCAWCPSILGEMRTKNAESNRQLAQIVLSPSISNTFNPELLTSQIKEVRAYTRIIEDTLKCAEEGVPLTATNENMDFYNSLQVGNAREHIICQRADFILAKKFLYTQKKSTGADLSIY